MNRAATALVALAAFLAGVTVGLVYAVLVEPDPDEPCPSNARCLR